MYCKIIKAFVLEQIIKSQISYTGMYLKGKLK